MTRVTAAWVVDEILALLQGAAGAAYYGEPVTQLEHALQAAHWARHAGADEEEVIAALLHDLGHLLGNPIGAVGVPDHDDVAREYLAARGFSDKVVALVAAHVDAKRYLTAVKPEYLARLSPASVETLALQGGPMREEEARQFAEHPWRDAMLRLRRWDELAKEPGATVAGLESYRDLLLRHLDERLGQDAPAPAGMR
jgi:predicted HD phosphohydrolase